jgi:hydrogenase maturation protein HypF
MHPGYLTTRWAMQRGEPKVAVQHHHAHIASCMAENGIRERVIGVAFDGTGYGTDGQVWGGEFLLCDYTGFERCAHLEYVALPGGDRAARQGWRMAAAYLREALGPDYRRLRLRCWDAAPQSTWGVIDRLIEKPAILTSSCGRMFDAVSAICGISVESGYEGESAMLLEAAADVTGTSGTYAFGLDAQSSPWKIETRAVLAQIAREAASGTSAGVVARRFHDSVARMIEDVCVQIRKTSGVEQVCLSGGTFQNLTLLRASVALLRARGFRVLLHTLAPPNDGGVSLGQAAIGAAYLERMGTAGT